MSEFCKSLIGFFAAVSLFSVMAGCSKNTGSISSPSSFVSSQTAFENASSSENLPDRGSSALEPDFSQEKIFANSTAENDPLIIRNDSIGIPDKAFYQTILKTPVDKKGAVDQNSDGILQKNEIKRIPKSVNWDKKGIQSIQGIETLPVSEIHLNGNEIEDISPLAQLSGTVKTGGEQLTIELQNNKVVSLTSFSTLLAKQRSSHIETLNLSNNAVADISPLTGISIERLSLSRNQIAAVGSFFTNNQSFYLDLSYNRIQALGACKFLAYSINLSHNKITAIQSLSASADELNLSDNALKDVSFLGGIKAPGPSKLDLSNNQLSVLQDMEKWGWTNLTPGRDGEQYKVRFEGNHLSQNELQTKLPGAFHAKTNPASSDAEKWLKDQVSKQVND